jgi:hypothetical protein
VTEIVNHHLVVIVMIVMVVMAQIRRLFGVRVMVLVVRVHVSPLGCPRVGSWFEHEGYGIDCPFDARRQPPDSDSRRCGPCRWNSIPGDKPRFGGFSG